MKADETIRFALTEIGFTSLEAEIYVFLLQQSPATGYRVAKGIGRSFTNVYKALASLQERGAILVDEGKNKLTRAVPLDELLARHEHRFREQRQRALEASNELTVSGGDARIYHLTSADQVYERCRQMLRDCKERAILELFPEPCAVLGEEVEAAAARGVHVAARVYADESLKGVTLVHSPYSKEVNTSWNTQWLALHIDGCQFLQGHLAPGGETVHEVIWSANPMLSWSIFSYANSDLHHYAFRSKLMEAGTVKDIQRAYESTQKQFPVGSDLGFQHLQDLWSTDWASDASQPEEHEE